MGGHPKGKGKRREGLGDPKNTGRRWLPPSFLVHDSVEGGEIEKVGYRGAEKLEGGYEPFIIVAVPAEFRGRFEGIALGRGSLLLGS